MKLHSLKGGRKHTQKKQKQKHSKQSKQSKQNKQDRNGRGGSMFVDVAASALLLAATQLMKRRPGSSKYVKTAGSRKNHRRR